MCDDCQFLVPLAAAMRSSTMSVCLAVSVCEADHVVMQVVLPQSLAAASDFWPQISNLYVTQPVPNLVHVHIQQLIVC